MAKADQILTANRLRDGDVVYWKGGQWVQDLQAADIFTDKPAAEQALRDAAAFVATQIVVNPYLFDARREGDVVRPVKEREIIRAAGPSVRRDLGKQASHVPL